MRKRLKRDDRVALVVAPFEGLSAPRAPQRVPVADVEADGTPPQGDLRYTELVTALGKLLEEETAMEEVGLDGSRPRCPEYRLAG